MAGGAYVYVQFVDALWKPAAHRRLPQDATRRLRRKKVERPLVVLGLPRTGTSLASYLLDQDPQRRSLLTWEAHGFGAAVDAGHVGV